ncbi:MAG: hypothetical protein H7Z38_24315 [Rubrivivax sp.]|nr:hypothetical protein [Pyrinomonadaceae bacterium]
MSRSYKLQNPRRTFFTVIAASALLFGAACAAATRPPDTERPRGNAPPYPVILTASDDRRAGVLANWKTVAGEQSAATGPSPELQPVTATLAALPANLSSPPRMPTVIITDEKEQSEEETRESLRRFIATAAPLLGVGLDGLSLVEVKDAPAGNAKTARYRQNPFPYPLRNGYGLVEITFTPDLRVVGLSSTAIPDTERLRLALAAVKPAALPTADKTIASLASRPVTFTDRTGNQQTRTITQADALAARELVVFPLRRTADAATIELHLAWEIAVGGPEAPILVYLDAVTGEQLAASVGS